MLVKGVPDVFLDDCEVDRDEHVELDVLRTPAIVCARTCPLTGFDDGGAGGFIALTAPARATRVSRLPCVDRFEAGSGTVPWSAWKWRNEIFVSYSLSVCALKSDRG